MPLPPKSAFLPNQRFGKMMGKSINNGIYNRLFHYLCFHNLKIHKLLTYNLKTKQMKRRNFLKKSSNAATVLGISTIIPQACSNPVKDVSNNTDEVRITHYVLFWLRDNLSEEEINNFSGFFEELKKVPNIKSLHYGKSINSTPRDVVDNSFTYNLLVYFNSLEDLETYGTHPVHLNAIDQYSKYWEKVVVHDSELK